MDLSLKSHLLNACRHLLKPVVRLLLHSSVTYKEFAEVCKIAFVEVASEEFGLKGRQTNASRVAILTGIGRKEVARLRKELAEKDADFEEHMSPVTRITAAWHQDPGYCNAQGRPRVLDEQEFENLVATYSGDVPAVALVKELKRLGVVELTNKGRFKVKTRAYVSGGLDNDSVRMLGAHLHDLGSTIAHNMLDNPQSPRRFQRVVSSESIPAGVLKRFRNLAAEQGQDMLEQLDDWLEAQGAQEAQPEQTDAPLYRTGVGIYFFEDKITKEART